MKANTIFQQLSPATSLGLLAWFQESQRDAYRMAIQNLAAKRRLRPQFLLTKPRAQQVDWLYQQVRLPGMEDISAQILQVWLLKGRVDMLKAFLDANEIAHDEGAVDDLPETLDPEKLAASIDVLLASWPNEEVVIYLILFNQQRPEGWEALAECLSNDQRLQLGKKG